MIRKLLVANRGEIARRIFRSCRELGIATVAVYSDSDRSAPFVLEADEAVPLGGASPAESYLRADLIAAAAHKVGADAVHPGYGFLSENADFARACADAGLIFVGPSVEAIAAMGSKLTAREMMTRAGVPVLPGRDLSGVPEADTVSVADDVGWPILVKASFGGGGRGMRVVHQPDQLVEAIASARREAGAAFGNDTVFLEHYVENSRHIEIQIFGDRHGNVTHFNERECSIQRRHQKIIEEAPSAVIDEQMRARMGSAAVDAGKALDYVGAGTVEFLVAPDGSFYFLEVNTRLQVEHPVTELVTGLDLVRLQIEVADGRSLPAAAFQPPIVGHAIEARLCAEDPQRDFLPAAGTLHRFEIPADPGIRVDSGVVSGDVVSTNYDSMLAKVIAFGADRNQARARLASALRRSKIQGITTNRSLLVGILESPEFIAAEIDTHFLDRTAYEILVGPPDAGVESAALVAATVALQAGRRQAAQVLSAVSSGFRTVRSQLQERVFELDGREIRVGYRLGRQQSFEIDAMPLDVRLVEIRPDRVDLICNGVRRRFEVETADSVAYVSWSGGTIELNVRPRFPDFTDHVVAGSLVAPMPGTVTRLAVSQGDRVSAGEALVILEAMKMEHTITSPADARVASVPIGVGDAVDTGTVLVILDEADAGDVPA